MNIAGSRGEKWDGPHSADLTEETFEIIVAAVRDHLREHLAPVLAHLQERRVDVVVVDREIDA